MKLYKKQKRLVAYNHFDYSIIDSSEWFEEDDFENFIKAEKKLTNEFKHATTTIEERYIEVKNG